MRTCGEQKGGGEGGGGDWKHRMSTRMTYDNDNNSIRYFHSACLTDKDENTALFEINKKVYINPNIYIS